MLRQGDLEFEASLGYIGISGYPGLHWDSISKNNKEKEKGGPYILFRTLGIEPRTSHREACYWWTTTLASLRQDLWNFVSFVICVCVCIQVPCAREETGGHLGTGSLFLLWILKIKSSWSCKHFHLLSHLAGPWDIVLLCSPDWHC